MERPSTKDTGVQTESFMCPCGDPGTSHFAQLSEELTKQEQIYAELLRLVNNVQGKCSCKYNEEVFENFRQKFSALVGDDQLLHVPSKTPPYSTMSSPYQPSSPSSQMSFFNPGSDSDGTTFSIASISSSDRIHTNSKLPANTSTYSSASLIVESIRKEQPGGSSETTSQQIGPNGTAVPLHVLHAIDWNSPFDAATRLLDAVFDQETLILYKLVYPYQNAPHRFSNCGRNLNYQIDPLKVADIVYVVTKFCNVPEEDVIRFITSKHDTENELWVFHEQGYSSDEIK